MHEKAVMIDKSRSSGDNGINMPTTLPEKLKPLSLFKNSFGIFKNNLKTIALIVLIIYLPLNLFLEFSPLANADFQDMQSLLKLVRINGLYEILIGTFAFVLLILLTNDAAEGKSVGLGSLWSSRLNANLYGRCLWTTFIKNILVGLLTILLIVPGVIFGVYWLFAEQIAVLDKEAGMKALSQSKGMIKNHWMAAFAIILAGLFGSIIPVNLLAMTILAIEPHWAVSLLLSFFIDLAQAFLIVYITVAFLEHKKLLHV